jgi:hypothetical protein
MEIALKTHSLMTTDATRRPTVRQRFDRAMAWLSDRSYDPHRFRNEVGDGHKIVLLGGHVVAVSPHHGDDAIERLAR